MTTAYTCITCRVAFRDLEVQRQHYKSDWHRYNLKRKVAELPPVSVEDFQKKVIALRSQLDEEKQSLSLACTVCKKSFSTQNQIENHLLSKRHKERLGKVASLVEDDEEVDELMDGEAGEGDKDEDDVAAVAAAVAVASPVVKRFKISKDKDKDKVKAGEMEIDSDAESVDSDEWLDDTENPIDNNDCLFCSNHSRSWVRNLKHMTLAHSFFVPDAEYCVDMRGLLGYLGEKICAGFVCIWCNDRGKAFKSVEAVRAHMLDKGHCKMLHEGDALAEYSDYYDYSSSYPDEEMADADAEVEIPEQLDESDYQLVLPSGATIGHRSLARYYKQSLNPGRAVLPRADKLRKVLHMYRALGWSESRTEAVKQKAMDVRYMQRIRQKYHMRLGVKANKLQHHFRQQVNF